MKANNCALYFSRKIQRWRVQYYKNRNLTKSFKDEESARIFYESLLGVDPDTADKLFKKKPTTITCKQCGLSVSVKYSRLKEAKYCGMKCYKLDVYKQTDMKVCAKCKIEKHKIEFQLKSKLSGQTGSYCKVCRRHIGLDKSHTVHDRWVRSKRYAIKSKGDNWWQLSEDDFSKLINMKCHYCDGDLGKSGSSLDRKNNNIGYTLSNSVSCCKKCNIVKNNHFTYEEMLLLSPTLIEIRINREKSSVFI